MFQRFDEDARQVVVLAQEEARILRHNYIGSEHLLLGMPREGSVASDVLDEAEIQPQAIRTAVFEELAVRGSSGEVLARHGSHARARLVAVEAWIAARERRVEVLEAIATAANMREATSRVAALLDMSVELAGQVMRLRLERLLNEGDAFRQERDVLVGLLKRLEEQD